MLSPDHVPEFEICDVQVVVYDCDADDLHDEYELGTFEYVIYDILKDVPPKLESVMMLDCREYYLYDLEDNGLEGIPIFTAIPVEKSQLLAQETVIKIPPASMVEPQLQKMFQDRILHPVKSAPFIKGMAPVLAMITGLSASQMTLKLKKGVMQA
jgi:hypothetical protein